MSKLNFTPSQLGLMGSYYFEDSDNFQEYVFLADGIADFISLGDPYDTELLIKFAEEILPKPEGKLSEAKTLQYFVSKCEFWAVPLHMVNGEEPRS